MCTTSWKQPPADPLEPCNPGRLPSTALCFQSTCSCLQSTSSLSFWENIWANSTPDSRFRLVTCSRPIQSKSFCHLRECSTLHRTPVRDYHCARSSCLNLAHASSVYCVSTKGTWLRDAILCQKFRPSNCLHFGTHQRSNSSPTPLEQSFQWTDS